MSDTLRTRRDFIPLKMGLFRRIEDMLRQRQGRAVSWEDAAALWEKRKEDSGKFQYDEEGFTYTFKDGPQKIRWNEIDRIVAYKFDRLSHDDICLDIFWQDWKLTISEKTPGWYRFIERIKTVFPTIPQDWEGEIAKPAFATNETVLYERKGSGKASGV